jgi:type VI secretion system protein ImpL
MTVNWQSGAWFLFFMGLTYVMSNWFNFQGQTWYFFMGIMTTLGLTSTAFFSYAMQKFYERRQKKKDAAAQQAQAGVAPAAPVGESDAQQWVKEANAKLAQSKPGIGIENLPMVFVVGDRGTAKTSTILNSGLEPELLSGQLYQQDGSIVSTRATNIFFARETVFVEAGGVLMANPSAWKELIKKLRPGRLKAIGKGTQAPRGVLLCFDLETFTKPGAAEAVTAAARYLQDRLGEISQDLGISFPVYVLFTRADRLPFFSDFVNNLNLDEAGQVVGITLPLRNATSGVYAEAESRRLTGAFDALFHSFCDHRLLLLPREIDPVKIPGAYEFPREFRKLRNILVQFLVDIGKPSQLRASPFLRGFYFSGVRPITITDTPVAAAPTPATPQQPVSSGATGMFRAGFQAQQKAMQAYAQMWSGGATRKVPQWLFLGHLFHDVILADSVSRAASGSSTKTSAVKRFLIGAAAVLCLLYAGLLTLSYFGNSSLESTALTAARNIGPGEAVGAAIPTEDALQRLDTLRQSLQQLTEYERDGAPLRLRWGLYSGSSMLPHVRKVYYNKFRQLLFGGTQDKLLSFLQRTPAAPGPTDDYGYAYDTLKAYLLTTSEWKRSSDVSLQQFLGSRLLARWSEGREPAIGKSRMDLAKLQFDFYARDLQNGNPYAQNGDAPAIDRTRIYLSKFSGIERVYRFLLSEAAKSNPPMNFNGKFPGSATVVNSTVEVAWAYTRDGWKWMQDQIKKQNFGGEAWVLGPYGSQGPDKATMEKGILEMFTKDYVEQWRNVLRRSNVLAYANAQDASRKLDQLTSSTAPLLALFWWTAYHTSVDLPGVADKFRAVHVIIPPMGINAQAPQFILPSNQSYNNALISLKQTVDRVANKEPDSERAMRDNAANATAITRQLSATFPPDIEARMDRRSEELLLQPIKYLDNLIGSDLRTGGAAFCNGFNLITSKFPFSPNAIPEVTLMELADILQPPNGKMWQFYNNTLKNVMTCQNGQCTPSGNPPINATFVRFFSQLMQFSKALYGDNGTAPNYKYNLSPRPSDLVEIFNITIDNDAAQLRGGQSKAYVWTGAQSSNFRLSLRLLTGGAPLEEDPRNGPWAVFRFFANADTITPTGTGYTFHQVVKTGRDGRPMQINGKTLAYDIFVDTGGGPAVFSKDFLAGLKCIPPLSR